MREQDYDYGTVEHQPYRVFAPTLQQQLLPLAFRMPETISGAFRSYAHLVDSESLAFHCDVLSNLGSAKAALNI